MGKGPSRTATARRIALPAGGGAFTLSRLAIGVFLVPQTSHRIAVASDVRRHIPLCENQGWMLPAHTSGTCEYDDPLSYLFIDFDDDILSDVGLDPAREFAPIVGEIDGLLLELVRSSLDDEERASGLYKETMGIALAARLKRLLDGPQCFGPAVDDKRLRRSLDYIRDNLADDLSIDTLSDVAGMSRYHFARVFKATLGQSPHQYVITKRIEWAKLLLRTTRASVAEIACRVGYADGSRFAQHFVRQVGTTPASFRH